MSDVVKNLKAARELISDPTRWTTDVYARSQNGSSVDCGDTSARCWCAIGAIWKYSPERYEETDFLLGASYELFGMPTLNVNDNLGHVAILKVYDHAIATAEASHAR